MVSEKTNISNIASYTTQELSLRIHVTSSLIFFSQKSSKTKLNISQFWVSVQVDQIKSSSTSGKDSEAISFN
jgi:hypothetical protein